VAPFASLVREIVDFPKPGIRFKDISPLLADGPGFAAAIAAMADPWRESRLQAVVGIEARGFILGAPLARELGVGFVPVRKPGKLPGAVIEESYSLEYGSDRLQVHRDALPAGARVLLVDDVLATGGTLAAAARLVSRLGLELVGGAVLMELAALDGRRHWASTAPLLATLRY
jgi:adenine phosphoribosyltransferase